MHLRLVSVASLLLLSACSSSNFDVPVTDDGGTSEIGTSEIGTTDSATDDVGADTCALSANPDTIYVDARASGGGTGAATCPVKSVREGLAIIAALPSGKRTLKIAGGSASAPLVYDESSQLVVKSQTSIVGDGAERVVLTGGGPCGLDKCVMLLEGGSSLEGVTVDAKIGNGLLLTPVAFTSVTVKNTTVTHSTGPMTAGLYVKGQGAVELGPGIRAVKNEGAGVGVEDIFSLRVMAADAAPNQFDDNSVGIVMSKGVLEFGGGSAQRNGKEGLYLAATPKHTVRNLVARENKGAGILLEPGAGLKLRGSTLVKNRVGVTVRFGLVADIDFGTAGDPGKNVFGGAGDKNDKAGICFAQSKSVRVNTQGDQWSACPPVVTGVSDSSGCESLPGYADIYFTAATSADPAPVDLGSSCTVGP